MSAVLFGGTLFLSAFLLFAVEPFVGKLVLPLLGGSPAVWNTCILFFQTALLVGYAWAHLGRRVVGERRHVFLHLVLALVSLLLLPLHLPATVGSPDPHHPVPWLIMTLGVSVGLPFVVLAATGPLLQGWFTRTRYERARDPYFLYAASNAGSLGGLLAYPSLVEPQFGLRSQAVAWSVAFCVFALLTVLCAIVARRSDRLPRASHDRPEAERSAETVRGQPSWSNRGRWVLLSAVPSSLLLGLTTYLTTDIAAIPLLWVMPLATYLLTFILTFVQPPVVPPGFAVRWQPLLAVAVIVFLFWGSSLEFTAWLPFHLLVFFVTALMCHGILAASRPAARHLTEFYLWIAIGGMLGGAFNVLVAPGLFDSILEYPLALALACALAPRSGSSSASWRGLREVALSLAALAAARLVVERLGDQVAPPPALVIGISVLASCLAAVAVYRQRRRPLVLGAALAAIVAAGYVADASERGLLLRDRDFFGVRKVTFNRRDGTHVLLNGSTKHGAQSLDPRMRLEPLSYYGRTGPLGDAFAALPRHPHARVGVIGLGTGAMAAYARQDEAWTFFELDPEIERIARNSRYFTYLADSPGAVRIVLGDGRLSLSADRQGRFDVLVLDAFSSDAIPVHLLTREALQLYLRKLAPRGALLFHLSNRYVDLEPVVASLVRDAGSSGASGIAAGSGKYLHRRLGLGRRDQARGSLGELRGKSGWKPLRYDGDRVWSDEFSNVLTAMRVFRR